MNTPEGWPTEEMIKAGKRWMHNWPLMNSATRAANLSEAFKAMLAAAPTPPAQEGEVVVTTDECGNAVAVTRQDAEGRILSVIWEAPAQEAEPVGEIVHFPDGSWGEIYESYQGKLLRGTKLYTRPDTSELRKKADILQDYWNRAQRDLAKQQDQISELRKAAEELLVYIRLHASNQVPHSTNDQPQPRSNKHVT